MITLEEIAKNIKQGKYFKDSQNHIKELEHVIKQIKSDQEIIDILYEAIQFYKEANNSWKAEKAIQDIEAL
ncbi:unnamed protein product [marine sediment metagenome]|uniref:Uncharacterized protein n=1 Tax=marine sediment metagenome TaxID=412755 RepID=X0XAG6_9ZZZZ